ncbi:MAG: ATP-binding protein [Methylobacter sp.]
MSDVLPAAVYYGETESKFSYSSRFDWQRYLGGDWGGMQFILDASYFDINAGKIWLIIGSGSVISLLLLLLVHYYQNIRRQELAMVDNLRAELRQSEERYRILAQQSSDAIFLIDPETLVLDDANLRFCQMLEYSYEQSRKLLLTDIVSISTTEAQASLQRIMDGCNGGMEEQVFCTRSGLLLEAEVTRSVVQVGSRKKIIATVRDISLRKRAEAERCRMEQQLRQCQKMEILGLSAREMAHDFNNILAAILGYTNLALTRYGQDEGSALRRYLEQVLMAGERARDLATRVLTYSRSQAGNMEEATVSSPAPLVKEVVKLMASTIPSYISLHDQIDADIPDICVSPRGLQQIVMNLVTNARDAMTECGRLDIRLNVLPDTEAFCRSCKRTNNIALCSGEIREEYVSLSVADTGCGVSQEHFKLMFAPYSMSKDVGNVTGFGLSVVQGFVRRAGGCIVVDSRPGEGTTVQVLLPVAESSRKQAEDALPLSAYSGGNTARILLIDDEVALAHYLASLLESEDYAVDVYNDPIAALNYFCSNPQSIDAVIVDQGMPNKTGIEIARTMLALRPNLPVFLCGGAIDENVQLSSIRRFFNKPINSSELLIALDEEMSSSKEAYV